MAKYMVVVSSYIDATIKEQQKDITFYLFKTLEELDEYIQKTPIRADTLFFSRDAIPLANTSLNYLVAILERVFFKVDPIHRFVGRSRCLKSVIDYYLAF